MITTDATGNRDQISKIKPKESERKRCYYINS